MGLWPRYYDYDALDNLTHYGVADEEAGPNQQYGSLRPHALTLGANGLAYHYDADGNVFRRGSTYYSYDCRRT